jgi:glutathione S-transferase
VLENHLKSQPKGEVGPWLVGGKFSYADLAFVPWQNYAGQLTDIKEYTVTADWLERMKARASVKKTLEEQ